MIRRAISLSVTNITLLIFVFILSSFSGYKPNANDDDLRVFFIARSKNANIVCYDVNLDKKGNIDTDEPLNVYWINKTDHPGERSGLSYIQNKLAYGYSSKSIGKGSFEISLVAFPSRKLILEHDQKGHYRGRMMIDGKQALLNRIYVQAKPDSFLKVAWVDLTGTEIDGGNPLKERIIPD